MLLACAFLFFSCSGSDEKNEISELEEKQKQIAQETVEYIKTPLEKANLAKEISDDHNNMVEETLANQ